MGTRGFQVQLGVPQGAGRRNVFRAAAANASMACLPGGSWRATSRSKTYDPMKDFHSGLNRAGVYCITHGSHGTRTVIPSGSPRKDNVAKNCKKSSLHTEPLIPEWAGCPRPARPARYGPGSETRAVPSGRAGAHGPVTVRTGFVQGPRDSGPGLAAFIRRWTDRFPPSPPSRCCSFAADHMPRARRLPPNPAPCGRRRRLRLEAGREHRRSAETPGRSASG